MSDLVSGKITAMKMGYGTQKGAQLDSWKRLQESQGEKDKKTFDAELQKAADGFEEIFVHNLLKSMRANVFKSGFLDGGPGEEIFQDMLDGEYAKIVVSSKALGLADMIAKNAKKN